MAATPPDKIGLRMMWWSRLHPPADPQTSFSGKTILITGANVGLGFEATLKFAALGATRLILGVRSLQRGGKAKAEICRRTGYHPGKIQLYHLDMSNFASVKTFAETISKEEPRLDVAVLNAGIAAASYTVSPEGYEMSLQISVLSTALLAILLLPQLRNSATLSGAPSHLELVGSAAHQDVKADVFDSAGGERILDQVSKESFFEATKQYYVIKLLHMYVMGGLVEATSTSTSTNHDDPNVIITTVCPGLCRTNLGRDFSILARIFVGLYQLILARSAEEGSRTLVSGVTLGKEAHGKFWSHDVFFRKGELITNAEGKALQNKVWDEIMEVLRKQVPRIDEDLVQ
ncbi:uncharacterized protein Z518_04639 [Rhinocladiella mackenziei CBS 650.93]|uniref:Short-chain dehydrogenase/reductase family protein n=1 Tax=Rhinocladiella mackenziei CBS 650.93 TaxID=1442369 RepID=A0A0D2H8A4_9EURO|nr:uncharacterized protein Z518_04639 [Rhinocladiella mackenziei CBS 650.93]KIX06663.1 hypothetical protein Z518_04639 [Rhinocladiella mackenziei CBS 650.93]